MNGKKARALRKRFNVRHLHQLRAARNENFKLGNLKSRAVKARMEREQLRAEQISPLEK